MRNVVIPTDAWKPLFHVFWVPGSEQTETFTNGKKWDQACFWLLAPDSPVYPHQVASVPLRRLLILSAVLSPLLRVKMISNLSLHCIRCLDHQRVGACNGFTEYVPAPACGETASNEPTVKTRSLNYGCRRGPPRSKLTMLHGRLHAVASIALVRQCQCSRFLDPTRDLDNAWCNGEDAAEGFARFDDLRS